jgi:hypothetical protein
MVTQERESVADGFPPFGWVDAGRASRVAFRVAEHHVCGVDTGCSRREEVTADVSHPRVIDERGIPTFRGAVWVDQDTRILGVGGSLSQELCFKGVYFGRQL